ncbi:hypothetical protein D3C80_1095000 [compost metagenome]
MRRLHRAAQVAIDLQLRVDVVAQAQARGVVPVVLADLAAIGREAHVAFAAGINHRQAAGQPQVRHQLELVADVNHGVRTLVAEVAGPGAGDVVFADKL